MTDGPTAELIRQAPEVLLHDHLDGGLRPASIVERIKPGYAGIRARSLDATR